MYVLYTKGVGSCEEIKYNPFKFWLILDEPFFVLVSLFVVDHRLLLRSTKPLLQSRNASVVMATAQLYWHLAPKSEIQVNVRRLLGKCTETFGISVARARSADNSCFPGFGTLSLKPS